MTRKIRLVVVGVAVAAVGVVSPLVWNGVAQAENAIPHATSAPTPVTSTTASPSPSVESTPSAVAEAVEVDVVAIASLPGEGPRYRNRAEAEELASCLRSHGVNAELREKTVGEPGFTFHVEGGDGDYGIASQECHWELQGDAAQWSEARLAAHNEVVEEMAGFLAERDVQTEVRTTKQGVKFLIRTGGNGDEYDAKIAFLESKGRAKRDDHGQTIILPTKAQLDASRAKMQALVDHLNSLGLEARVGESEYGPWLDADLDDVDVLMAKEEFEWDEDPYDAEQIAYHNKDTEALAAHLRERGHRCEIKTNRYGLKYADHDNTEEVEAAVEEFWENHELGN